MTEAEWLAGDDLWARLLELRQREVSARKVRLFGVAACRRIWSSMWDPRCRAAVEAAEQFADGGQSDTTLASFSAGADGALGDTILEQRVETKQSLAAIAAFHVSRPSLDLAVLIGCLEAIWLVAEGGMESEQPEQAELLRDIFGNPFRPVAFSPEWRTSTVVALAKQMYESRDFSAMPILADALQDAGCDNDDVLNHCRNEKSVGEQGAEAPRTPHVRGCWVVDLVLGKT